MDQWKLDCLQPNYGNHDSLVYWEDYDCRMWPWGNTPAPPPRPPPPRANVVCPSTHKHSSHLIPSQKSIIQLAQSLLTFTAAYVRHMTSPQTYTACNSGGEIRHRTCYLCMGFSDLILCMPSGSCEPLVIKALWIIHKDLNWDENLWCTQRNDLVF